MDYAKIGSEHLANRILRWFVFTLLFALLPIIIVSLIGFIFDINIDDNTTELLFFTIMLCATSLNDIQENKIYTKNDFVFNLFFCIFIVMMIIVSVLYGSILFIEMIDETLTEMTDLTFVEMINVTPELFDNKIKAISVIVSGASGIISFIIQLIIHRTEVTK